MFWVVVVNSEECVGFGVTQYMGALICAAIRSLVILLDDPEWRLLYAGSLSYYASLTYNESLSKRFRECI